MSQSLFARRSSCPSFRIALLLVGFVVAVGADRGYGQDLAVRLGDAAAIPGSAVTIPMHIDNSTPDSVQGFSFSFWCSDGQLDPVVVSAGSDLAALNGGAGPDFLNVNVTPPVPAGTGITCGTVFSFLGTDELLPGLDLHALDMLWEVLDSAAPGTVTGVDFCDCLGAPLVASVLVILGDSIPPATFGSVVEVLEPVPFRRGDPNASGAIDLGDPIYTLNYLFQSGPSVCLDALDSNADAEIDLADVLYLLAWINGVGSMPPAPFPACDLGGSSLGCDSFGGCR
ncbi:MAG: hypothetical protein AAF517_04200 [Planctomycetota bacterium]